MNVVARLRFVRMAPRKVRPVLDLIRGKSLTLAESQLTHLPRRPSRVLLKLLKSAQANAVNNFKLDPKTLFVKQAYANEGPKLKRFQPRAMGRAHPILKRSSHVTVVLDSRTEKIMTPEKSKTTATSEALRERVKGSPSEPPVNKEKKAAPQGRRSSGKSPATPRISHPGEKWKEK